MGRGNRIMVAMCDMSDSGWTAADTAALTADELTRPMVPPMPTEDDMYGIMVLASRRMPQLMFCALPGRKTAWHPNGCLEIKVRIDPEWARFDTFMTYGNSERECRMLFGYERDEVTVQLTPEEVRGVNPGRAAQALRHKIEAELQYKEPPKPTVREQHERTRFAFKSYRHGR